jgi:acyl-CoA synthetase (NDP forming)
MTLDRLLRPRSIAVFGGSAAEELIRQCDRMGYAGEIWPVHPHREKVGGRAAYASVQALPGSPDAAYLAINRNLTVDVVRALAARGAGGAVCYATGFAEAGAEGAALQDELLAACGDMPLIGPNCYGLLNYVDGAMLWPDQQGGRRVARGVAIITMSSNVAFNLTMQRRGLPIAYVVSLGNKLRFDLHDAIQTFAELEAVSAIGLYLESISDPAAFAAAVTLARQAGKPVVAIKTGRSAAAQQMVLSHTASLSGADELLSALFARAGVTRVDSLEALVEALKVLHVLGPLAGPRVIAMSTSGGDLSLLGDGMIGTSLRMPPLSASVAAAVRAVAHERLVVANPLDYQMFDWNDEERLAAMFTALLGTAGEFDIALSLLDHPRADKCDPSPWRGAERGFARAVAATGARGAVMSTFTDTMPEALASRLIDEGIVPLAGIDTGLAGVHAAVEIGQAWRREVPPPLLVAAAVPSSAVAHVLDEAEAKAMLRVAGVAVPRGRVVSDAASAAIAAAEIGFPVAVKALGIAHKTEVRAVQLGIDSAPAVAAAVAEMAHLADRFLVESMVEGVVAELIVGVARDTQFGPYLVLGGGGVLVELLRDTRSLLLPVTREEIAAALASLQCAPLLNGFRGRPPADTEAAIDAIAAIAAFAQHHAGTLAELDVNPLMVRAAGEGVCAADAVLSLYSFGDDDE